MMASEGVESPFYNVLPETKRRTSVGLYLITIISFILSFNLAWYDLVSVLSHKLLFFFYTLPFLFDSSFLCLWR